MYGAYFNYGIEKVGDNIVLKFYIASLCDEYVNENLSQETMNLILDIVFNPLLENNMFKEIYVNQEKENLKKIIESRKDDKSSYAYNRCIEEMFKNEPYGIYRFGNFKDLEQINPKNLYDYYKEMIYNSKIDVLINGKDANKIEILNIESIKNYGFKSCEEFKGKINNKNVIENSKSKLIIKENPNIVNEELDVTQGKLNIGLLCNIKDKNSIF